MADILEKMIEANVRGKGVVYGTGAWNVGEIKESKAMDEAYTMGKEA
jgi:hypothetical protein